MKNEDGDAHTHTASAVVAVAAGRVGIMPARRNKGRNVHGHHRVSELSGEPVVDVH